jgi:AAA+ superfamily predicted ATPase
MSKFLFLEQEIQWFSAVLSLRLDNYFQHTEVLLADLPSPPPLPLPDSPYSSIVRQFAMNVEERLVLLLALCPHIRPQILDLLLVKNQHFDKTYTEFGGIKGTNHTGFLPTGETAAFIVAGNNLALRINLMQLFDNEHFFYKNNILKLQAPQHDTEPFLSGALVISKEYLAKLTSGLEYKPEYSPQFPAKRLTSSLTWEDLVVEDEVREEIEEVKAWLTHSHTLLETWGMKRIVKAGFRCLFYGLPGTGKTLTASLIGNSAGMPVYRVDLSMLVSKYIGETEKNLASIFEQAENKNWILFFDEADALFGKRTQTNSSNDRHANQEIAYLLQRIEDFNGLVILATNLKGNIDEAFARRFQAMIYFSMPSAEQRFKLWQNSFSTFTVFEQSIDLRKIAQTYELAGGSIINISQYCSLKALQRKSNVILMADMLEGIKREFRKEGKIV